MNGFYVFIVGVATLMGFASCEFVVCNASPGLVTSQGNTVSCYTSINGFKKEYNCPWARCNAATAKGCQINSHQWNNDVEFTCDKDYSLPVGDDVKIICNADKSWNSKCNGNSGPDCPHNAESSYEAECTTITYHSHCHGCTLVP